METALIRLAAWPAHLAIADRRLVEVGRVPIERQAAAEIPASADALIAVEIHHLHDDPFRPGLVLVLRIEDTLGVVRVDELDDVAADMVRGAVELLAHRVVEPALE